MININNRFIHVESITPIEGKPAYAVVNTKSRKQLALIEWYPDWGKYTLVPLKNTIYDTECLESIFGFMKRIWVSGNVGNVKDKPARFNKAA